MEKSLKGRKQSPEHWNNILRKGERRLHKPGRTHTKLLKKGGYSWLVGWEKEQGRWDVVGVYLFIF